VICCGQPMITEKWDALGQVCETCHECGKVKHPGCGRMIGPFRCCSVVCGDCLELMKQLPDGCVDFIFTDPPFGHNNNNGDLIHQREAALGRLPPGVNPPVGRPIANDGPEANELVRAAFRDFKRLLREGGCCCCCGGGGGPDPQFARWSLWLDEALGFKHMVVWDKGPMGMGWHYRRSYETVLVGMKPGGPCKWYDTSDRVENIIRNIPKIIPQADDHPTPKPRALVEHFIKLHSTDGDIVLDPFMGHGTTGEAAVKLGRHFLGFEISPEYCEFARKRIALVEAQPSLFEKKPEQANLYAGDLLAGLERMVDGVSSAAVEKAGK